jgi:Ca2+-binding RTX toxin-like protein
MQPTQEGEMARREANKRCGAIAAAAATAAAAALALPTSAGAAYDAEVDGRVVRFDGNGAADTLTIGEINGRLSHNQRNNGFASPTDFDSSIPGDQPALANGSINLFVNAGDGDDVVTIGTANVSSVTVDGQGGNDALTGNDEPDLLRGGANSDAIVGGRGGDDLEGGDSDDVITWNNGDGSDVMEGEAGFDTIEVNGAPAGDVFKVAAAAGGRARFDRTNLIPFSLDIATSERLDLNGLGGDDQFSAEPGTGLALIANGNEGNDSLSGSEGADTLLGGAGNDALTGGAGPDIVDGQNGDDVLDVRDGSFDRARGGAGTDDARTDQIGIDALESIENVDALPSDGTTNPGHPTTAPGDAATAPDAARAPALRIVTKRAKLQRRKGGGYIARIKVSCQTDETGRCKGRLELLTARAVKMTGRRAPIRLGKTRYDLGAGENRTLRMRLISRLNRFDHRGKLAARARTATSDADGRYADGRYADGLARIALTLPNRGR